VQEPLSITVRNDGSVPIAIRYLRLTGSLLGVHFVRYQASANDDVAPGESKTITVPGDFFDVDGVATGYLNATMQVVDQNRNVLASQPFVADVQGKVASTFGILLLEALAFAIIGIAQIVLGLARHRLPRNRFVRGIFFALTAASAVIAVVVAASMSRVALFGSSTWVPVLAVITLIGFVLGYLSPGRPERGADDAVDDEVVDLVAAEAVARASGEFRSATSGSFPAHQSGDHTGSLDPHESGDHTGSLAPHQSGDHTGTASQHDSGEHAPPARHESGGFDPLA
jgi:hypothetical protein